jgi:hypothetical protein
VWYASKVKESWLRSGDNEDDGETGDLRQVRKCKESAYIILTISPSRAIAGKSVGGASLWRSMPSNTRTNFFRPSSRRCSCTNSTETLSHLPFTALEISTSSVSSNASLQAITVRSRRCRAVIHSRHRIIACGVKTDWRTFEIVRVLAVPSRPCRTRVGGLGTSGYRLPLDVVTICLICCFLHGIWSSRNTNRSSGSREDIV